MDLSLTLKGQTHDLPLKNPVLTASGTFGYGVEFATYGDLTALGGMVAKGISLQPRQGNPSPRIVETTSGMLNSVGLQNDGVESFCKEKLPLLPWRETAVIANIAFLIFGCLTLEPFFMDLYPLYAFLFYTLLLTKVKAKEA